PLETPERSFARSLCHQRAALVPIKYFWIQMKEILCRVARCQISQDLTEWTQSRRPRIYRSKLLLELPLTFLQVVHMARRCFSPPLRQPFQIALRSYQPL